MAINYTTLTADKATEGSIKNWLNYSLVPSVNVLAMAEAHIYERLRVREMRVETAVSIAAGADYIDLPARFLDPIRLMLNGDAVDIDYVQENLLKRFRDLDTGDLFEGSITEYAIINEKMLFDVASEEARAGYLWFYQTPAPLSGNNETNWLTTRYPALLTDACLAYGNHYRKFYGERDKLLVIVNAGIKAANDAADLGQRGQIHR